MAHSPPSPMEAEFYYAGLPSNPRLVARTGSAWEPPSGQYPDSKELRPVGNHPLTDIWEDSVAFKLHALLNSMDVQWTSTDVVRIGLAEEPSAPAPVVLWIGVVPASIPAKDGVAVAEKCRDILVEFNITDVEVEIRESIVTRSARAGPKLLTPSYSSDLTVHFREPFTPTLGIPICAQSTPWDVGSGGFFIAEGEGRNAERLLLVTARHVAFPVNENENELFECKNDSQPRHNVILFSDAAFNTYLESLETEIGGKTTLTEYYEGRIKAVKNKDDPAANRERQTVQAAVNEAQEARARLSAFYQYVSTQWAAPESRVLGHVVLSPPISVGSSSSSGGGYTEDWAVIEIDGSKIDASNFNGNAIDLLTHVPVDKFTAMMHPPNAKNARSFSYPFDRLLRLKDTIPEDEMRRPAAADQNGEPGLMVLKRGGASGLTVGRANNICSYARYYPPYYINDETSKEWAILPRNSESGPFSKNGDSGSVVVDGRGRMGGLLTGGTGRHASLSESQLDITYATPVDFILKRMQEHGLHKPHVNPVLAA
ncbi:hypothetical protein DFH11DRAFT_556970 [Phellopilus nigrolimitatus]|nr:hypothetical protein DFH11DRAFT_556970 [Phellopilus nigrolimitatus]